MSTSGSPTSINSSGSGSATPATSPASASSPTTLSRQQLLALIPSPKVRGPAGEVHWQLYHVDGNYEIQQIFIAIDGTWSLIGEKWRISADEVIKHCFTGVIETVDMIEAEPILLKWQWDVPVYAHNVRGKQNKSFHPSKIYHTLGDVKKGGLAVWKNYFENDQFTEAGANMDDEQGVWKGFSYRVMSGKWTGEDGDAVVHPLLCNFAAYLAENPCEGNPINIDDWTTKPELPWGTVTVTKLGGDGKIIHVHENDRRLITLLARNKLEVDLATFLQ